MARKPLPSQEVLRQLLDYDPETGVLRWEERNPSLFKSQRDANKWNARFSLNEAGGISREGYRVVRIGGSNYKAHVLAWVIAFGLAPIVDIDHINGDRSDNRVSNLRAASRQENAKNMRLSSRNKSGVPGIGWYDVTKKWKVSISHKPAGQIHLGYFEKFEDALAARKAAERKYGFHENHGRAA